MEEMLSPSFTHEKLDDPTVEDLIDVFEDLWRGCIFEPVKSLIASPHGSVAAMCVLCSYYEAIESLYTGNSSRNRSQEFFVKGFSRVFSSSEGMDVGAKEIYIHVRCGLAHEGMLRSKVHYSNVGRKPFFLTYPKNDDGSLDLSRPSNSIVVNPERMFEATVQHFVSYVKLLRSQEDTELVENFESFVTEQYAVGSGDSIIGMTYEEFSGEA